jgi:hypothetical protein
MVGTRNMKAYLQNFGEEVSLLEERWGREHVPEMYQRRYDVLTWTTMNKFFFKLV